MGQKGPSDSTINTQNQLTQEQLSLAHEQDARSSKLFNLTEPGMQMAENFYKTLASGNKGAIQRAAAPAEESIARSSEMAKRNIQDNMPRGGAKDLALQEADITKSAEIGTTEAQAYLQSFPALASLAGTGIGLSIGQVTTALQAFSGASSSNQAGGTMEGEGKAQTLGFIGALGGDAAQGAGMAVGACVIAEALWGRTNLRTIRLRVYLTDVWAKNSLLGRGVMWAYGRWGNAVARQVERRTWVRKALLPVFEYADRAAYRWEVEMLHELRYAGII